MIKINYISQESYYVDISKISFYCKHYNFKRFIFLEKEYNKAGFYYTSDFKKNKNLFK